MKHECKTVMFQHAQYSLPDSRAITVETYIGD